MDTKSTVKDIVDKFGHHWPEEWRQRFPILVSVTIPTLNDSDHRIFWLGPREEKQFYTVKGAWSTIEYTGPVVHWHKVVWNKAFIPKHALCMWMACHNRLPTQDRIIKWKNEPPDLKCMFCKGTIETHDHLFFECTYSQAIWSDVKKEIKLEGCPNAWRDILNSWMLGRWRHWSTLHKVAISATVYHIWLERTDGTLIIATKESIKLYPSLKRRFLEKWLGGRSAKSETIMVKEDNGFEVLMRPLGFLGCFGVLGIFLFFWLISLCFFWCIFAWYAFPCVGFLL